MISTANQCEKICILGRSSKYFVFLSKSSVFLIRVFGILPTFGASMTSILELKYSSHISKSMPPVQNSVPLLFGASQYAWPKSSYSSSLAMTPI